MNSDLTALAPCREILCENLSRGLRQKFVQKIAKHPCGTERAKLERMFDTRQKLAKGG